MQAAAGVHRSTVVDAASFMSLDLIVGQHWRIGEKADEDGIYSKCHEQ